VKSVGKVFAALPSHQLKGPLAVDYVEDS
jgi:hypothetical protein